MPIARLQDSSCSVARSLSVLGERWTLLVIREAVSGVTRFEEFRQNLGVAADVLSDRLTTLVEHGVMTKEAYREAGKRERYEYFLTDAGRELHVVIGGLQQWGDAHMPRAEGPSVERRSNRTAKPVRVAFVDERGREIPHAEVDVIHAGDETG